MRFALRIIATSLLTFMISIVFGGVAVWADPQPWKVSYLYRFKEKNGGLFPNSALVQDAQGALYGSTTSGGAGNGTIYKLTPSGRGYTYHVIHAFHNSDGWYPEGPLIVDNTGSLYGTTRLGGLHSTPEEPGPGLVFKLTPSPHGYVESVLHFFRGFDGRNPSGGLVMDASGSLYGLTSRGGGAGYDGTVYKLTPTPTEYAKTTLYRFPSNGDSLAPFGEPLLDRYGSIYGVTGGNPKDSIAGSIFKLTPARNGYSERTLYGFVDRQRGARPGAGLISDGRGALFGTTTIGGANNAGVVYKLAPTRDGYVETVIFSFTKTGTSGAFPNSKLVMDASGAIYGTASKGGTPTCIHEGACGTVFRLMPNGSAYVESTLFLFGPSGNFSDGDNPQAGVIGDASGAIYGTASEGGGDYGRGTIFKLQPQ